MSEKADGARWHASREDWRRALYASVTLSASDKLVALRMLEAANRRHFLSTGELTSWLGVDTIAEQLGLSERGVRKARENLGKLGIVELRDNRGGRSHKGATCAFLAPWLNTAPRATEITETSQIDGEATSETRHGDAAFSESASSRNPAPECRLSGNPAPGGQKPGTRRSETRHPGAPDSCEDSCDQTLEAASSSSSDLDPARARKPNGHDDDDAEAAQKVIACFDRVRTQIFGDEQSRSAQQRQRHWGIDVETAKAWLAAGASADDLDDEFGLLPLVFQRACWAMRQRGARPPRVLRIFDANVRDALASTRR